MEIDWLVVPSAVAFGLVTGQMAYAIVTFAATQELTDEQHPLPGGAGCHHFPEVGHVGTGLLVDDLVARDPGSWWSRAPCGPC